MTEADALLDVLPQRIALDEGVVIRTFTADDIPALVDVVNRDLAHLRPWMPWAQQPATVEGQMAWWRSTLEPPADADAQRDLPYGIFDADGNIVGGTGFHLRGGRGVVEIGYWLAASATGRGLMTRVVTALVDVARGVDGVRRVEIKCDVENERSAAVPRRLGFRVVREEKREPLAASETGRLIVWALEL
ncbi:MAG TPA: GNAT family N-acetyltransferase [Mycobacteriales bacterium]|nr:GNAT family N-acetyltransferase [Mycobacteriales bacterium]